MAIRALVLGVAIAALPAAASAADITFKINAIDEKGVGQEIGWVRAVDTPKGLQLVPRLKGLKPGDHGFHIHTEPDCGAKADPAGKMTPGLAAGGHWDPTGTGKHLGPAGAGHMGDLPALKVEADGTTKTAVAVQRLKVDDIRRHSLMIHAGGDNYADQPAPLGGGGARVACGVIR